ncbi:TetR/AcrR family transcriptional regulator [Lacisediminimonas sp.]|uniref:TetR/AcrR family transcriptional regulator n=1 Tax=Lacisediminimonas sp. TaxID=3060582 RepID=UPI00271A07F3|nr:TetR/AcrR family transcriptional regulator [Lacisediminimonas sp.]MDO8300962.1 TetR/AcrR family transcriptional regulator [Lacisediminimonas sp.]
MASTPRNARNKTAGARPASSRSAPADADEPVRGAGDGDTRRFVLGKVYELISEHGIESLSMRTVAQAVQMSTGTINHHFGNKRGLLIAALESAYELPWDWEEYRGSPANQLRRLVLGYVLRGQRDRFWRFWINYLAMSTRDDDMLSHQKVRYARQERFWAKLISDAIDAGEFKSDIDPHKTAEALLVLAHGFLVRQLIVPDADTRSHARKMLSEAVDRLVTPTT